MIELVIAKESVMFITILLLTTVGIIWTLDQIWDP